MCLTLQVPVETLACGQQCGDKGRGRADVAAGTEAGDVGPLPT